jgi:hypothetical protein
MCEVRGSFSVFGDAILDMVFAWPPAKKTLREAVGKPIKPSVLITKTAILIVPIAPRKDVFMEAYNKTDEFHLWYLCLSL